VIVHEHCGEAGAIGGALRSGRLWDNGRQSTFIGLEASANIQYKTTRNEATRCYFCRISACAFIDVKTSSDIVNIDFKPPVKTKGPSKRAQRLNPHRVMASESRACARIKAPRFHDRRFENRCSHVRARLHIDERAQALILAEVAARGLVARRLVLDVAEASGR